MKIKYVLMTVFFLFMIGIGIGLKMFFKPQVDVSKLDPVFTVVASDLLNEFQKDEDAATAKYSEKTIEIKGKLVSKNKLPNGTDLLILENEMEGISFQLDKSWADANQSFIISLEPGTLITLKGICKGYLMEIKVSPAVVMMK